MINQKSICVMCGRKTIPFVFIGQEAVGPSCARRIGLTVAKAPKGARLSFVSRARGRETAPRTLDLFPDL